MARRLAWGVVTVTTLAVILDVVVVAQFQPLLSEATVAKHGFPIVSAAVVGSAVMGALVISQLPRHPVGWLLLGLGLSSGLALLFEAYNLWVKEGGGPGPTDLAGVSGWLSLLLGGQLGLALAAVLFLVAPDGRFLSARWRAATAVPAAGLALCCVALALVPPAGVDVAEGDVGDSGVGPLSWAVGLLLIVVGLATAVACMVVRLRRSVGVERQQVRLVALSALLLTIGIVALAVVHATNGGEQTWAAGLPLFLAYLCLPILFAVAVLRFRLFDIEVIVNRALLLGVGTFVAGAGYTAVVVLAGRLADNRTGRYSVSFVALVVVALGFQPLRQMVVRLANRVAFGPRAQPYEALAALSRALSVTPDDEELLPTIAEAAARSVGAFAARVVLAVPTEGQLSYTWPEGAVMPADVDVSAPVADADGPLAVIELLARPGLPLGAAQERVLRDLAEQSASALRNVVMQRELAARIDELDRATADLTESRRRLIDAEDHARRQLEAAVRDDVLRRLSPLPARLAALAGRPFDAAARAAIEEVLDSTGAAHDALRELTRGVFPTVLARSGLAAALRSGPEHTTAALDVDTSAEGRFPSRVEAVAYAICVEAIRSAGPHTRMVVSVVGDSLRIVVQGASPDCDDAAWRDRAEAADGVVEHVDGRLVIRLPVAVTLR